MSIINSFLNDDSWKKLCQKFCIYGAGEISRCLIPLCQKFGINIPFTIDRNPKIISDVPSFVLEEIPDKNIPIIITAYDPKRQIINDLKKFTNAKIEYLEDILD